MHGHVQTRILAVSVVWKLIISIIIYLDAAMYSTEIIYNSPLEQRLIFSTVAVAMSMTMYECEWEITFDDDTTVTHAHTL